MALRGGHSRVGRHAESGIPLDPDQPDLGVAFRQPRGLLKALFHLAIDRILLMIEPLACQTVSMFERTEIGFVFSFRCGDSTFIFFTNRVLLIPNPEEEAQ